MAGVPKIWDVIKKGVQAKFGAAPPVTQFLVNTAFAARTFAIAHGFDTPFFNKIVFSKIKAVTGGSLRLALSGGGPLNTEVQIFVRTAFGCPLFQGYGLTETCAGLSVQDPSDLRAGIAGVPIAACEVKLESCADITDKNKNPYLISDTIDTVGNKVFGRGEILVRGNNITKGYYMMEEKTKEEVSSCESQRTSQCCISPLTLRFAFRSGRPTGFFTPATLGSSCLTAASASSTGKRIS